MIEHKNSNPINPLKVWFENLPLKEFRDAKQIFIEKFNIPRSSFYSLLKEDYSFSSFQKVAFNAFSEDFNNTKIFV